LLCQIFDMLCACGFVNCTRDTNI